MPKRYMLLLCLIAGCDNGQNPDNRDLATAPADMAMDLASATDDMSAGGDMAALIVNKSQIIDADGGIVNAGGGFAVAFPMNTVDSARTVTVTTMSMPPSTDAGVPVSPVYSFGPDGTVFAHPVLVTVPLPPGAPSNTMLYWTKHDGSGAYENVGGTVVGGNLVARVTHFSQGFLGTMSPTRTVSGTQLVTYIKPIGVNNIATDLTAATIAALVPNGSGGFTTYAGSGLADGSFNIPGVPVGNYLLRINKGYWWTNSDVFDAGRERLGRPDFVKPTMTTSITFNVTSLDTWQNGDELEFFSPEVDTFGFGLEQSVPVTAGATALNNWTIDTTMELSDSGAANLIDGSKGDTALLAQLSVRSTTDGGPYTAMSKIFNLPSFTQTDGGNTTSSGAFTDVSAANTVSPMLKGTQFVTYRAAINPAAYNCFGSFDVLFSINGQPYGKKYGMYSANIDYLLWQASGDATATGMTYGTPTTSGWDAIGGATLYGCVDYTLPGTTTPATVYLKIQTTTDLASLTAAPIVPQLTPVQGPKINGLDLFTARTGVGTTPTISWQAPAVGTATQYGVGIQHLVAQGTTTTNQVVANFRTGDTSLQLPPGLLVAGESYFFQIIAFNSAVPLTSPSRNALPSSNAGVLSAIIQP